jgi:hypothetical protein
MGKESIQGITYQIVCALSVLSCCCCTLDLHVPKVELVKPKTDYVIEKASSVR